MPEPTLPDPSAVPDGTAVRVALWRYLHLQVEAPPHVFSDDIGFRLAAPPEGWRDRPDMNPQWTLGYRAAIVGRARLVEDLVLERAKKGPIQYVLLGAGLDTFAQRHPEAGPGSITSNLKVFEIDQPATQDWKRQRLMDLGYGIPERLKLVPVDLEKNESWPEKLKASGFDASKPALVASTGVSMYLTKEAVAGTLRQAAQLAHGIILAMTFLLPLDLLPEEERAQHQMVYERARQAGTPFISFFSPAEMMALAHACGFKGTSHISRDEVVRRYFAGRTDGFQPSHGEEFLVATA